MTDTSRTDGRAQFPWGMLLSLYSAFTFLMLDVDMALLHLGYRHQNNFFAVLPLVFCVIAALVSLVTAFNVWMRRQAWVLGLATMLIGGIGTIIHLEIAFANLHGLNIAMLLERLVFDPRPPLAPAALAGTGLLLVMVSLAERWPISLRRRKRSAAVDSSTAIPSVL